MTNFLKLLRDSRATLRKALPFVTTLLFFFSAHPKALGREVEFGWEPMEGALKYEIQLSLEPDFEKPTLTQEVEKPQLSLSLEMGRYFYRVRVIDKKSRPGHWSKPQPVVVAPYPPELSSPKNGQDLSYFEVLPNIGFEWKPVTDSKASEVEYDVFIYKPTGQKVEETRVKDPAHATQKIGEGEYLWKVRTVAQKIYVSEYGEPRRFQVAKNPLRNPILKTPEDNGNFRAYKPATFSWEQDPVTKYTDLTIETLPSAYADKSYKKTFANLAGGSTHSVASFPPGDYAWSIRTKEAKDTPGLAAGPQSFHVRDDMIAAGNFSFEYGYSPTLYALETQSNRLTGGGADSFMTSKDSAKFQHVTLGYYPLESVGMFFHVGSGELNLQGHSLYNQVSDLTLRYRGAAVGFQQEFLFGWRQENSYELYDLAFSDLTVAGPMFGTRMIGTPAQRWRVLIGFNYFHPLNTVDYNGKLEYHSYEFSLGARYNVAESLWIGYRVQYGITTVNWKPYGIAGNEQSNWQIRRIEPLFLSIGWEQ